MNIKQEEMLKKCINVNRIETIPYFKGIFIIQQRKLHDSGYRMMYVIGHTEYDEIMKDFRYYLLSSCSDVVDFNPIINNLLNRNYDMCDLHLDIDKNGIIHIWTNSNKYLNCEVPNVSSCMFEIVRGV